MSLSLLLLSLRFVTAYVRIVEKEMFGYMVAFDPPEIKAVPIHASVEQTKFVSLECNTITAAPDLGASFGG